MQKTSMQGQLGFCANINLGVFCTVHIGCADMYLLYCTYDSD